MKQKWIYFLVPLAVVGVTLLAVGAVLLLSYAPSKSYTSRQVESLYQQHAQAIGLETTSQDISAECFRDNPAFGSIRSLCNHSVVKDVPVDGIESAQDAARTFQQELLKEGLHIETTPSTASNTVHLTATKSKFINNHFCVIGLDYDPKADYGIGINAEKTAVYTLVCSRYSL